MGFALVLLVWSAGHFYLARRLVRPMPHGRRRWWTVGLVLLAAVLPLLAMSVWRNAPTWSGARVLSWVGYWSFGLSSVVVTFVILRDLVAGILRVGQWGRARWFSRRQDRLAQPDIVADPQRRMWMANTMNMGIVGGAASLGAVGGVSVWATPAIKRVAVPIRGLPPAFHGFRIAQLTDVHVGPTIGAEFLRRVVAAVNEQSPDLVAVTGDLVDGHVPILADGVAPLADLEAPHGAYFVTGNHEYYWGAAEWIEHLRGLGLDVLQNEHRVIERDGSRLVLGGVTDHRGGASAGEPCDPAKAFAGCPTDGPKILLAHQPRSIFDAERVGVDLQLSGHTHGGQYFPFSLLIHLVQPFVRGLHRAGRAWIYVSCGTGYWGPPMRVGAPSEITIIELVATDDEIV